MKKWYLNFMAALIIPLGIVLIQGCYPNDSISTSETDIILTGQYDSVDFKEFSTYYLNDTVWPVREDTSDHSLIDANDLIIDQIVQNMTNYGYTRITDVDPQNPPDLMVASAAITVTTVTVGWWYPYYPGWGWGWYKSSDASRGTDYWYGGYPGYYPPGWGWGGVPYYSSYTSGTLLMEMTNPLDFRIVDNDTVVPMYWAGAINGILGNGTNSARITNGIDQAFTQSPYLKTN